MTKPRHTSILAMVLVALLVVDGLAWRWARSARAPLAALDGFDAELATALEVVHGDERVRLEREDGRWFEVAPTRHPADPDAVASVLGALAAGVRPDARLGADLADYGLEGADPIRAEAYADEASLAALYIGHDAPGGASFVRFSGSEDAYRARIGGRARFERSPGDWLDRFLWRTDAAVSGFSVHRDGAQLALSRTGDAWTLADDPEFPVDPVLAQALAEALAAPRAVAIHPPDRFPASPSAELAVQLADGTEHRATLAEDAGAVLATVEGVDAVYQLPPIAGQLLADRASWRDKTLWTMDPATLRELEWVGPEGSASFRRDPQTGSFALATRDPAVAAFLVRPRAARIASVPATRAGLPGARSLVFVGQRTETLQLGAPAPGALDGIDAVYVRAASRPDRIGLIPAELVRRLESAFHSSDVHDKR